MTNTQLPYNIKDTRQITPSTPVANPDLLSEKALITCQSWQNISGLNFNNHSMNKMGRHKRYYLLAKP